jgi:hypothetical protein
LDELTSNNTTEGFRRPSGGLPEASRRHPKAFRRTLLGPSPKTERIFSV